MFLALARVVLLLATCALVAPIPSTAQQEPTPPAEAIPPARVVPLALGEIIRDLAFSPDSQMLASYHNNATVKLWNLSTGRVQWTFEGDGVAVIGDVTFSPDGRVLVTTDRMRRVRLLDVASGELHGRLTEDAGAGASFSPDGRLLAFGVAKGLKLWDLATGVVSQPAIEQNKRVERVVWSPDGKTLATLGWQMIFPEGLFSWPQEPRTEHVVTLWDVATWRQTDSRTGLLKGERSWIGAFSPDGRWLIAGENLVELSNSRTLGQHRALPVAWGEKVVFSPDGRWLAFALFGGHEVRFWDLTEGRVTRALAVNAPISAVAVSPDGRRLAVATEATRERSSPGALLLWDASRWIDTSAIVSPAVRPAEFALFEPKNRAVAPPPSPDQPQVVVQTGHAGLLTAIAVSDDGRWVASSGKDKLVMLWGLSGRVLRIFPQTNEVRALAFSRDGKWLASEQTVWDVATGREARTLANRDYEEDKLSQRGAAVAFSPDGSLLARIGRDRRDQDAIEVLDVPSMRRVRRLAVSAPPSQFPGLAFSPDGRWLALVRADVVQVWDTGDWRLDRTLTRAPGTTGFPFGPDGRSIALAKGKIVPGRLLGPLTFSADGEWVAHATKSGGVALLDTGTGIDRLRHRTTGADVIGMLAVGPDGKRLATAESLSTVPFALWGLRVARIWNLSAGVQVETIAAQPLRPDRAPTEPLDGWGWQKAGALRSAATPDGRVRVTSGDTTVSVIDVATGQEHSIGGHSFMTRITGVAVSPDGRWAASAAFGANNAVKVWDVAAAREHLTLDLPQSELYFSPDGTVLAASTSSQVRFLEVATGREIRSITPPMGVGKEGVSFAPDGRLVAIAGEQGSNIGLWEWRSGALLHTLIGHRLGITAIAFLADGCCLVSASRDRTVRLWDARTGEPLAILLSLLEHGEEELNQPTKPGTPLPVRPFGNRWLVVTPDGLFDGSPEAWSALLWRFSEGAEDVAPPEAFFNEFYRPGLLAELIAGRRPRAPRSISALDRRQPQVTITAAAQVEAPAKRRAVEVTVEIAEAPPDAAHAQGSGARDVRLFRNGALVKVWRGDVLSGAPGKTILKTEVQLVAGANQITAYTFNRDNVKSEDARLTLTGAESLRHRGTAYVLAVGLNRYANPGFNLRFAEADARAFSEQVKDAQAKLSTYARVESVLLLNQEATKANILLALKRLAGTDTPTQPADAPPALARLRAAEPEDAVFVYFAGHGLAEEPRFYLIPHDLGYTGRLSRITETGLQDLFAHGISDVELEAAFEKIGAGRVVLVIDACNSGQALEAEEKRRGPMNSRGLAQLAYEKGMYVLTAAQSYQGALEAEQFGHGLLTFALVQEGIGTAAADTAPMDGEVVVQEWFDYASARVPEMQTKLMAEANRQGRSLAFVEGEEQVADVEKRSLQHPRAFYRREGESQPFVIVRPSSGR